ncbi:3-dehydroquinate synthase [Limisalsivibrio acetivorans]|uniref:3-dehydroquinate synthase n=1 Tax=Limisalsivibrio acetivorans TaxID=1304888 RepID=UPI0003B36477|nr:3-dehydroquinate synthase [Limisalsivibrio acetivorans]
MRTLRVELKGITDNSYDIQIGRGYIKNIIAKCALPVVDMNVHQLYPRLFGDKECFVFSPSEDAKSFDSLMDILEWLRRSGCRRDDVITAIGGGITGDLAGFAASCYMRGIGFIQIPTTLLSMVDSSVGGKTGINFSGSKNNIGAFWQPEAVYIDMDFLSTLSDEEYLNGLAEVIKYGAMFDKDFFRLLMEEREEILDREPELLAEIVETCCRMKADVVNKDEREGGYRKTLNYGHTFGHAIESDSGFGIKHGFAVAAGMYLETLWGEKEGYTDKGTAEQIAEILDAFGFEKEYTIKSEEIFFKALASDKKAGKSGFSLALTERIGAGTVIDGVEPGSVHSFFQS